MSSIDRRVVEMEFDNKQFGKGVKDTLDSLEELKKGLMLDGATKGLQEINRAGQDVDLSGIASGVDHISNRFSALGAIGFTVIQNLTTAAMEYANKISGLVLDPLVAGGRRRAQNIEQAKFQFRGLGVDVERAMADALYGVQDTAYGLDEAAKAASQLSASQVQLGDDMKAALRGISGVAAMTNSSYEDTARVFTRVAGQGRVMAVDLNSLAARGLNAAATLAEAFNMTEAEVRELVTEGQISFDMFSNAMNDAFGENATKANETYSGSLSNVRAALSRIGADFFTPFLEQQRDLFNELKPAIDEVGAALGPVIDMMLSVTGARNRGLGAFISNLPLDKLPLLIDPLLGIIENLYDGLMDVIDPLRLAFQQIFPPVAIEQIAEVLEVIERFTESLKMGAIGSENLRRTFAGVFAVFSIGWSILKEIAVFLFDIFGIVTEGSGGILDATANIGDFFVALDLAVKRGEGLTKFFEGLTNILRGPIKFVKELASALLSIFDFDAPSVDNVSNALKPLGDLGEFIISIWDRITASFKRVFGVLEPLIEGLGEMFGGAGKGIVDIFSDLDFDQVLDTINTFLFGGILAAMIRFAKNLGTTVGSVSHNFTEPFRRLTFTLTTMQNTLRAMTLMQIAIAIGLLAGSVVALSTVDPAGLARALAGMTVMFAQLAGMMSALTVIGGLKGLTATGTGLLLISFAIRVLAGAVKKMGELSWEEIAKGLTGVTVLIGGLVVAVKGMSAHTAGMISAGAGLLILAFAIKVLASSVTDISALNWEDMAKGLVGVGTLLASLAIFSKFAAANKGGLAQGAGLLLLATGIKILASAVQDFAGLSWEEIAKGLASVTAILAAFAVFSKGVGAAPKLMASGAALVLVGAAMKILASAMQDFAGLRWEEIAKGLVAMSGALIAIVAALNLMPPNTLASAAAFGVMAFSLGMIADVLDKMGGMGWVEIAKGLVTLAGALVIISAAMIAMNSALPGAAALLVVSGALSILAPVLLSFSKMSIGEIATALGVLAGAFVVIGVAGLLLAPITPVLLGLGTAVALLGAGLAFAGAGVFLFAAGLTALAAAGGAGIAVVLKFVEGLARLLPTIAEQLGLALVIFVEIIAESGPAIFEAMSAVLGAVVDAIVENAPGIIEMVGEMALQLVEKLTEIVPKMAKAALDMMIAILEELIEKTPTIVGYMIDLVVALLTEITSRVDEFGKAATALIVAVLNSIADNIDDVITAGASIVIAFIEGLGSNTLRIMEAAADVVIDFINGLAQAIDDKGPELQEAGVNLAGSIIDGMTLGLSSKVGGVISEARGMAQGAIDAVADVLDARSPSKEFRKLGRWTAEGFASGIIGSRDDVISSWRYTIDLLKDVTESSSSDIDRLQSRLETLTDARELDVEAIRETEEALARARYENERGVWGLKQMTDYQKKQRKSLVQLGTQYDENTDKLKEANRTLRDAIQTRDDYNRSIEDQYSSLPSLTQDTDLEDYINQLEYANADILKFSQVLQKLREMGLSDTLYEEFLASGPDILPFLEELLAGGAESVEVVNNLTGQLETAAQKLGKRASRELYQAGVRAARGLVNGLRSKRKELQAEMEEIARIVQNVLRLTLRISSPSKVMEELGRYTIDGLTKGMQKSVPSIKKAAAGVGKDTVEAMRKSISDMHDILAVETDMNPTIAPVLDLTEFRKGAAQIGSELSDKHISIDDAYAKAKYASFGYQSNQAAKLESLLPSVSQPTAEITYNQYNQSPKALSSAEIYRQTKNQLSVTKGALTPNAAKEA